MTTNYPGQWPSLAFPSDPTVGQEFLADNSVTYVWTGDRWSSALAVMTGKAKYVYDGEYSASNYISNIDKVLDGGTSTPQ